MTRAFGSWGGFVLDLSIVLTQIGYTVAQLFFCTDTLRDLTMSFMHINEETKSDASGYTIDLTKISDPTRRELYAVIFVVIFTLLAWVRTVSAFRHAFTVSNFLILLSVIIITYYSI